MDRRRRRAQLPGGDAIMMTHSTVRQGGMSLIELMVALLIGTIILLGLVEVFAAARTTYQSTAGVARVQENARFALDYLQRDLRMVGHFGCANDQSHKQQAGGLTQNTGAANGAPLDFQLALQGYEAQGTAPGSTVQIANPTAGWSPALPAHLSALNPSPGSDIIMMRYFSPQGAPVTGVTGTGAGGAITLPADSWPSFTAEGVPNPLVFGIADCNQANVFMGTGSVAGNVATVTVGSSGAQLGLFNVGDAGLATLHRANAVAYFVAPGASGVASLWRARWNGTGAVQREELVEGIERLQLLYGQDQAADVSNLSGFVANVGAANATSLGSALTAGGEHNWRRVGMVQVGVLAASTERAGVQAPQDASRPVVLGVTYAAPDDGRLRVAYESTVALRNRLYGN